MKKLRFRGRLSDVSKSTELAKGRNRIWTQGWSDWLYISFSLCYIFYGVKTQTEFNYVNYFIIWKHWKYIWTLRNCTGHFIFFLNSLIQLSLPQKYSCFSLVSYWVEFHYRIIGIASSTSAERFEHFVCSKIRNWGGGGGAGGGSWCF